MLNDKPSQKPAWPGVVKLIYILLSIGLIFVLWEVGIRSRDGGDSGVAIVGRIEFFAGKQYRNRTNILSTAQLKKTLEMYALGDSPEWGIIEVRNLPGQKEIWKRIRPEWIIEPPPHNLVLHEGEAVLTPKGFTDRAGNPLAQEPDFFVVAVRRPQRP